MNLFVRMVKLANDHSEALSLLAENSESWTARPISVSGESSSRSHLEYLYQVHTLQTNDYDCGVWVLAAIAAVLRGYHVTALAEHDMRWWRRFVHTLVLTQP
jgi:hypothetical protein